MICGTARRHNLGQIKPTPLAAPTQPPSNVAFKRSLVDTIKTTKQGLVYKYFLLVQDGVFDVLHLKSNGRVCENMD